MLYEIVIREATTYDGSGMPGYTGELAIQGDRLVEVGGRVGGARREFQVEGLGGPALFNRTSILLRCGRKRVIV